MSKPMKMVLALLGVGVLFGVSWWLNFGRGDVVEAGPEPTIVVVPDGEVSNPPVDESGDLDGVDLGELPGPGAGLETLTAELEKVAGLATVAFFEYGVGDTTALDRLERLKPYIDEGFFDTLDADYEDYEFDIAIEEGLWNHVEVVTTAVATLDDLVTPRMTENGVFTVFVDTRQAWLEPGGSLDDDVHYLRMFELLLIRTPDGVKVIDLQPADL